MGLAGSPGQKRGTAKNLTALKKLGDLLDRDRAKLQWNIQLAGKEKKHKGTYILGRALRGL